MSKIDQCAGANTVNKQIQLVEKWLADPSSVSKEELKANNNAANVTYNAAYAAAKVAGNAAGAANAAATASHYAAYDASEWVAKYHKEVKEQGQ